MKIKRILFDLFLIFGWVLFGFVLAFERII